MEIIHKYQNAYSVQSNFRTFDLQTNPMIHLIPDLRALLFPECDFFLFHHEY